MRQNLRGECLDRVARLPPIERLVQDYVTQTLEPKRRTRVASARVTFDASLDALRPRGMMVSIGASSGAPNPLAVATLNTRGSLFLTRPSLAAHATDLGEYRRRAAAVFAAVSEGVFTPSASQVFPLGNAADAHALLESGKATGTVLLKP